MKRVPELDGLRGIAILLVMFCHYIGLNHPNVYVGWLFRCGFCGVDLFFVLSGFLIGGILLHNREAKNYYSIFYVRRVLRILPLFVISMVVVNYLTPGTLHFSLLSNATFTQDIFAALSKSSLLMGVVWSLAVEEKFYLMVAPTVRVLNYKLEWIVLSVIVVSPFIRVAESVMGGDPYARMLPFGRMDSLAVGLGIALLAHRHRERALSLANKAMSNATALAIFMVFVWIGDKFYSELIFSFAGYSLLALIFGCIVLHVTSFPERWGVLRFSPLQRVGVLSYALYLLHCPVYAAVAHVFPGFWTRFWVSCLCTYFVAEVSWRIMESKLIRLGQSFSYRSAAPSIAPAVRVALASTEHAG